MPGEPHLRFVLFCLITCVMRQIVSALTGVLEMLGSAIGRRVGDSLSGEPASGLLAVVESRVSRRFADSRLGRGQAVVKRLGLSGGSALAAPSP